MPKKKQIWKNKQISIIWGCTSGKGPGEMTVIISTVNGHSTGHYQSNVTVVKSMPHHIQAVKKSQRRCNKVLHDFKNHCHKSAPCATHFDFSPSCTDTAHTSGFERLLRGLKLPVALPRKCSKLCGWFRRLYRDVLLCSLDVHFAMPSLCQFVDCFNIAHFWPPIFCLSFVYICITFNKGFLLKA